MSDYQHTPPANEVPLTSDPAKTVADALLGNKDIVKRVANTGLAAAGAITGERNGNSKLTIQQVRDIRSSMDTCRNLVRKFRISKSQVEKIRRREQWKNV